MLGLDLHQQIGTSEIGTVSGGERKKIAIARMLLQLDRKEIIILDETFANLDSDTSKELLYHILDRAKNKIIFIVSHNNSIMEVIKSFKNVNEIELLSLVN